MRNARGRRPVWRAATRAAEQARDGDGVGEAPSPAEEAESQKGEWRNGRPERQSKQRSENTLHIFLCPPSNASANATTTAATAAAAAATQRRRGCSRWSVPALARGQGNGGYRELTGCIAKKPICGPGSLHETFKEMDCAMVNVLQ